MKKSNIFVHKKRALRVFAKNYGEVFEWEFESLPMGGSQRCQDWCQSLTHYCRAALPTYLRWKHPNILTHPLPLGQFLHLLPTPLWMTRLLSSFFPGRKFAFFSIAGTFGRGAAPFLGQLAHFMNHNTLYRPTPLHCCQPIFRGCAAVGCGARVENKNLVRAMAVLTAWHWLVNCILRFALP